MSSLPAPNRFWPTLSAILRALLVISALAWTVWLVADVRALRITGRWLDDPTSFDLATAQSIDSWDRWIAITGLCLYAATAVTFICWLYQAHHSAAMDRDVMHNRSGWAIGSWFVPFYNLAKPVMMVHDVRRGALATPHPPSGVIGWWWGVLLAGTFLARIANGITNGDRPGRLGPMRALHDGYVASIAADVATAGAAVLGAVMVTQLSREVIERHRRITPSTPQVGDERADPVPGR